MAEVDFVIDKKSGLYQRTCGTSRDRVVKEYSKLYGAEHAEVFDSGMSAIYNVLRGVLSWRRREKMTMLYGNELYCDTTSKVIEGLKDEFFNIEFIPFDVSNDSNFEKVIKNRKIVCLFLESASNPSACMFNWELLKKLDEACYVVVDNTWLTAKLFNPLNVGAHIVVESCSKYGSKGRCISGAAAFKLRDDYATKKVTKLIKCGGIHLCPMYCDYVSEGIGELSDTMDTLGEKTKNMVEFLSTLPKVSKIDYPTLQSHKTNSIYKKYVGDKGPGVIWFETSFSDNGDRKKRFKQIVKSSGINLSTSFCKSYSLIDSWPKYKNGKVWVRMSLGYLNEPDLNDKVRNLVSNL